MKNGTVSKSDRPSSSTKESVFCVASQFPTTLSRYLLFSFRKCIGRLHICIGVLLVAFAIIRTESLYMSATTNQITWWYPLARSKSGSRFATLTTVKMIFTVYSFEFIWIFVDILCRSRIVFVISSLRSFESIRRVIAAWWDPLARSKSGSRFATLTPHPHGSSTHPTHAQP